MCSSDLLVQVSLTSAWFGHRVVRIEMNTPARVAFITRLGRAFIPNETTVLQDGDAVHVMIDKNDIPRLEHILSTAPEEG